MSERTRVVDPVTQCELLVPAWSTPEESIRREADRRDGRLRTIEFSTDYSAELPLWEHGLLSDGSTGLTLELLSELKDWVRRWELAFDPFEGWSDPSLRGPWIAGGHVLADR